jgi:hypothetical protein
MGSFSRKLVLAVVLIAVWVGLLWVPIGDSRLARISIGSLMSFIAVQAVATMRLDAVVSHGLDFVVNRRIRRWIFGDPHAPRA